MLAHREVQAGDEREERLAGAGAADERDERDARVQQEVERDPLLEVARLDPEERVAAASYTNSARYVVRPAGAALGGWLTGLWVAAPFVAAGALKIVYDLLIFAGFRNVREADLD